MCTTEGQIQVQPNNNYVILGESFNGFLREAHL